MSTQKRPAEPQAHPPATPSVPGPRLWVFLACEDSPKLCTARRLVRLSLAKGLAVNDRAPAGALLLDPHSPRILSSRDAAAASRLGIVAVDCSWNRLGDRGGFPEPLSRSLRHLEARRLPFLLAANAQHYGRLGELNTAEALGAAVYLTFGREVAETYFLRLTGGSGLLKLNEGPLEEYAGAGSDEEILAIERRYFG